MGTTIENLILAVITTSRDKVGGGSPIFYAVDEQELQSLSFTLEKILDGIAHEVNPNLFIIVRH
ncbi:capping complex subunit for YIEGIA [Effusibacillus dendaii]|uniref:Uncharacterized protein n=1 Tax=Effusibacillus dendaii TaxID=2743772 RepID=A0A7I8D5G3_9BACL|nr:hypothetical protein [Effusibacillus dendaii]BCJ85368.1 hypothetical protein skT53_03530 [Effusibacillus dendaii]